MNLSQTVLLIKQKLSWKLALAGLLATGIFGFLLVRSAQGIQEFRAMELSLDATFLVLSFVCYISGVILAAKMWSLLLKHLTGSSDFAFDVQAFGVSLLARKVPGFIWEALSRLALYERRGVRRSALLTAVAAEVIFRSVAGALAFVLALLITSGQGTGWGEAYLPIPAFAYLPILTAVVLGLVIFLPRLHKNLLRWFRRAQAEDSSPLKEPTLSAWLILKWLSGYLGVLLFSGLTLYFFIRAFGHAASVPYWTIFGAFGLAVALGPISMWLPGDIGIRDGVLYLALITALSGTTAAVLVLAIRLWVTLSELVFGAVCAGVLGKKAANQFWASANATGRKPGTPAPPKGINL